MIPTLFGLVTCAIGLWLYWRGTAMHLLCGMLALGLFESSAAIVLPALSGSSVPPPRLMLVFLLAKVAKELRGRRSLLVETLSANAALLIFAAYGVLSAFTLPHLFAGQIHVVPLRPAGLRHLTDTFPLFFSPQNITTAFYIAGTGIAAGCAYVAARLGDVQLLVKSCVAITLAHATTGILGVALAGTPWDAVVDFVRNGSYSQLNQSTDTFARIAGFMAEPSNFARFGTVWLIFSLELWLRRVSPRGTGIAALTMLAVLAVSTSSTAYVGLAAYAAILAFRFLALPRYLTFDRVLTMGLSLLAGSVAVFAIALFSQPVMDAFTGMLDQMTVQKAGSSSGQQRLFWAMQGVDAFVASGGLGIGAGSFRSSSLIMAVIGSMGVIGTASFLAACATLLLPRKPQQDALRSNVSEAAAWAAVAGLVPAMVMQGSPDPGMEFAALSGASLALRLPVLSAVPVAARARWGGLAAVRPESAPRADGWRRFAR